MKLPIGDYALNENMAIGLNIGYYKFATKSNEIAGGPGYAYEYPALTIIPIIVDFKYVFKTEGFMPYVGAGLGVYVSKFAETTLAGYVVASSSSSSDFGFSPKVGFWMGDGIKYGASLEYNMVSNANHLGINVGLAFPLGK